MHAEHVRDTGNPQKIGTGYTPGNSLCKSQCDLTRARETKQPEGNQVAVVYLRSICCAMSLTNLKVRCCKSIVGCWKCHHVGFLNLMLEPKMGCDMERCPILVFLAVSTCREIRRDDGVGFISCT